MGLARQAAGRNRGESRGGGAFSRERCLQPSPDVLGSLAAGLLTERNTGPHDPCRCQGLTGCRYAASRAPAVGDFLRLEAAHGYLVMITGVEIPVGGSPFLVPELDGPGVPDGAIREFSRVQDVIGSERVLARQPGALPVHHVRRHLRNPGVLEWIENPGEIPVHQQSLVARLPVPVFSQGSQVESTVAFIGIITRRIGREPEMTWHPLFVHCPCEMVGNPEWEHLVRTLQALHPEAESCKLKLPGGRPTIPRPAHSDDDSVPAAIDDGSRGEVEFSGLALGGDRGNGVLFHLDRDRPGVVEHLQRFFIFGQRSKSRNEIASRKGEDVDLAHPLDPLLRGALLQFLAYLGGDPSVEGAVRQVCFHSDKARR